MAFPAWSEWIHPKFPWLWKHKQQQRQVHPGTEAAPTLLPKSVESSWGSTSDDLLR